MAEELPADRFRPPDPSTLMPKHNIHSTLLESSSESSYNSLQVREEAIHTAMAGKELDGSSTNIYMEESQSIGGTKTGVPESQDIQDRQKSLDFTVPFARNVQATEASSVDKYKANTSDSRPQTIAIKQQGHAEYNRKPTTTRQDNTNQQLQVDIIATQVTESTSGKEVSIRKAGTDNGKQLEEHDDKQVNKGNKVKVPPDDYGALNSEDEIDPDNQSMEESDEDAKDTMQQTGQVLGSSFHDKCTDVQRVTEQQGLSPRGRKQTRHQPYQPITSMSDTSSRPMTRSKSKDNSHIDMVRVQLQMDHTVSNPNGKIWLFWSNEGEEEIAQAACDYYQHQFTGQNDRIDERILYHIPTIITPNQNEMLQAIPNIDELRKVVCAMNPYAAAGPDGFGGALANYTTGISSLNNVTIAHFLTNGKWNERKLRQQWPSQWPEVVNMIEHVVHEVRVISVRWKTPSISNYKLNTDGSALNNPRKIGRAGILRDSNGIIVYAFAIPLGKGTNNQAEVQATSYGLNWCIQHGFVQELHDIAKQCTYVHCVHTYREANRIRAPGGGGNSPEAYNITTCMVSCVN
ncbi:hypothetical protein MTR67_023500 [Solanum verrucosum]|uniref:RNase H type-1 domain-containing protein n=1 Tax=Solanum verrucosum TaxID=315347 RepID=A0AAF0TXP4_SOLVR|nr:hypothetical protein MTR67_023500 [Solanum verrucosum]